MIPVLRTSCPPYALPPVLLKNAYFSSTNRELSKGVRLLELAKEKLSIPLEPHDKAQLSEIFQVFLQKFKQL